MIHVHHCSANSKLSLEVTSLHDSITSLENKLADCQQLRQNVNFHFQFFFLNLPSEPVLWLPEQLWVKISGWRPTLWRLTVASVCPSESCFHTTTDLSRTAESSPATPSVSLVTITSIVWCHCVQWCWYWIFCYQVQLQMQVTVVWFSFQSHQDW